MEASEDSSARGGTPLSQRGCTIKYLHEDTIYDALASKPTLKKIMLKDVLKAEAKRSKSKRSEASDDDNISRTITEGEDQFPSGYKPMVTPGKAPN